MWQILLSFRVLSFCELLIFFYKGLLIHSVGQVIRMSLNVHVCTQGTIIFHGKFAKLEGLPLTVDIGWIAREDMSVPWRWMVTQFSAVRNHISPPWATLLVQTARTVSRVPVPDAVFACGHASTAFIQCWATRSLHIGLDGDAWWCPKARLATVSATEQIRLIPPTRKTRTMLTY